MVVYLVKSLIIIGAGQFALEVLWVAQCMGEFQILGFCDDDQAKWGQTIRGLRVFGPIEGAASSLGTKGPVLFHCGVGFNRHRQSMAERAGRAGWQPATLIAPLTLLSPDATIGPGCFVGAGSIVSVNAVLGSHVLINKHCTIGHDSDIANYAQVCPGGRVSGNVRLGEGAMVGSNAVIAPRRCVGAWGTVAAVSFASRNVEAGVTVIGVPAQPMFGR